MVRTELCNRMEAYQRDHYPDGVVNVVDKDDCFYVLIVDNKYNPNNFWYGFHHLKSKGMGDGQVVGKCLPLEN